MHRIVPFFLCSLTSLFATDKIFPPDAVINVTRSPYLAVPDDTKDDTAAIQQAITDHVGTGRSLYFPAGTYLLSHTLVAKNKEGLWCPHLTLQGQNRKTTRLKLIDRAPGFQDPHQPQALFASGSLQEPGDSSDGGGNKAFRNNVFDLTFDTGNGNPGAIGIDYAVSNQGAIKDVDIESGDGAGRAGIAMLRRIPGPGLIKNVRITGFDFGIDLADIQYGLTLENVSLHHQKTAGIRVTQNLLHIHKLESENQVPALQITDRNGCVTLIDAKLDGGAPDQYAIESVGTFFGRDLHTDGYRGLQLRGQTLRPPYPEEISSPASFGNGTLPKPLPIAETPDYWNPNLDDWMAVGPRLDGENDDTAAIQRAIDSGKSTIYFPNNRVYFLSDTVIVRGAVRQILGMGSEISLGAAKEPFSNITSLRPLLQIETTSADALFLDNLFFNAQYPGEVLFENHSTRTVVIRHSAGWVGAGGHRHTYRNTSNTNGPLFVEDVFLPGWDFQNQTVWARQFNPENYDGDGSKPQVSNRGGKLWILGFKTEGPAPFLATTEGGTTELLGAYNYISATALPIVPQNAIPYVFENANVALTFVTENFRDNDYPSYLSGQKIRMHPLPPRNGVAGDRSFAVPLFRSASEK